MMYLLLKSLRAESSPVSLLLAKRTRESVLLILAEELRSIFLWQVSARSGFDDSIPRMQGDHKAVRGENELQRHFACCSRAALNPRTIVLIDTTLPWPAAKQGPAAQTLQRQLLCRFAAALLSVLNDLLQ